MCHILFRPFAIAEKADHATGTESFYLVESPANVLVTKNDDTTTESLKCYCPEFVFSTRMSKTRLPMKLEARPAESAVQHPDSSFRNVCVKGNFDALQPGSLCEALSRACSKSTA